jgi:nucleoside 2-deoxyribosyltransferase
MNRPLLYLAAPLFNGSERSFNLRLKSIIEHKADVYLPQLDGDLIVDLIARGVPHKEATVQIFHNDVGAIQRCNIFLAVLNGRTVDEGVSFELGVAWCLKKPCFGYKDDFRRLLAHGDNPMIERAIKQTFQSESELTDWLATI